MAEPEQPRASESEPDAPPVGRTEEEEAEAIKAANRFDIRRLIGGLFTVYGVIVLILGIAGSAHVKHKADGINIDLWAGLAMLVFAALMIFWALARPVAPEPPETDGQGSGPIGEAPAT